MVKKSFPRGSEWRKWDLHVHAPLGKLYDGYRTKDGSNALDLFCDVLEASDVQAFGITDYFSFDSFKGFLKRFREKYPTSTKVFFFNLELRLNETVNMALEEVNVHLLFNPRSFDLVPKFLTRLSVVKTGKDATPIMCSELKTDADFQSATVTRASITKAFEETFGPKADRRDHFLVVTAANNDGIRPERGKKRKENICDEIDKFSDAFLGGSQNIEYYLKGDRYKDSLTSLPKPVIAGSDSHSFDDLDAFLGKRVTKELDQGGKKSELIERDITWIKADPTYEGLKQILYEPHSGERVYIGPVRPNQKEEYKVIRRIRFDGPDDFPDEIEFNDNLCSVIGSRSSGKSALLAYIAHSIDPEGVEQVVEGPGEGEDYHWDAIALTHSIEWANGKTNAESPGSVVYVPQNYLFEKSKDPGEIKEKISPVLFKVLPHFASRHTQATANIGGHNAQISDRVVDWFNISDEIKVIDGQLKELGDKKAIEWQQKETNTHIRTVREKNKLSEDELKKYQGIRAEALALGARIKEIDADLGLISNASSEHDFFIDAKIGLTPALGSLPAKLQEKVRDALESAQVAILKTVNEDVVTYKGAIGREKEEKTAAVIKIKEENKELFEKHQKNAELEGLVKTSAVHAETLRKITVLETSKKAKEAQLRFAEKKIAEAIAGRGALLDGLVAHMKSSDQSALKDIRFDVEHSLDDDDVEFLRQGINVRENTDFVDKNQLRVDVIRANPAKFLSDLYSGKQKINARHTKQGVASSALQLTEKILFTAEMEGDKIGGFSEPTMTPGKRALFALRLILAESDDTWPLLIDQPEDDLDSRSIYDEVVPFLKEKKKERQIIMVSHNANLVIGSDSEQLVIANRHGNDRKNMDGKQFNYLTGSLEFTQPHDETCKDTLTSQGVCEHACAILDGGRAAFEGRKNKYQIR
jgi:hypothetical protein